MSTADQVSGINPVFLRLCFPKCAYGFPYFIFNRGKIYFFSLPLFIAIFPKTEFCILVSNFFRVLEHDPLVNKAV